MKGEATPKKDYIIVRCASYGCKEMLSRLPRHKFDARCYKHSRELKAERQRKRYQIRRQDHAEAN